MTRHVSRDDLLKHHFFLASARKTRRIRAHLAGCESCRHRLEQLEGRFSALELLRRTENPSGQLLARTLHQVEAGATDPVRSIHHSTWRSAGAVAAAIVLTGGVLLALWLRSPPGPRPPQDQRTAAGSRTPSRPPDAPRLDRAESAPFAPASRIELVVLPRRDAVQLTIYNSADLTLVREQRDLTLKQGWNWLQFMWANTLIDPTSLNLEPRRHTDKIQVKQLVFPPGLPQLGRWLIRSEVSGQVPFHITYLTSGLKWRAFYEATLSPDERAMHLQGYVRVTNNSGEDYEDARTRLIVSKIHLLDEIARLARSQYPYGRPGERPTAIDFSSTTRGMQEHVFFGIGGRGKDLWRRLGDIKKITKEGLSEYFLYTIERTETINNGWGKRLSSFAAAGIPVQSVYKYDEERWGQDTVRFLSFANDEDHKLGQTPLPDGQVRIFRQLDPQAHLAYLGATSAKYIPVNEEVELDLGSARLVGVEATLMAVRTENHLFDDNDGIAGWDEVQTWQIKTGNRRELAIKIEITRGFDTPYWDLDVKHDRARYAKLDARRARFTLDMDPQSTHALVYTARIYHGKRQEAFAPRP